MKNAWIFVFLGFLMSCSDGDSSSYPYSSEQTIYSETRQTMLRELVFMVKPYMMDQHVKKYIVSPSMINMKVMINGEEWGVFESVKVDTAHINKEISGDFYTCVMPVKYVVKAPYLMSGNILTTAGAYADLLNRYISLEPGSYVCQIEYFEIIDNNHETRRIYPLIAEPFDVEENTVSAFIGEFEIPID